MKTKPTYKFGDKLQKIRTEDYDFLTDTEISEKIALAPTVYQDATK